MRNAGDRQGKNGGSEENSEQEHGQQNFFVSTDDIELHKTCY